MVNHIVSSNHMLKGFMLTFAVGFIFGVYTALRVFS